MQLDSLQFKHLLIIFVNRLNAPIADGELELIRLHNKMMVAGFCLKETLYSEVAF